MPEERQPRRTGRAPDAENSKIEQERRALRELIDKFRREPESDDDGGFYRNVGRFIIRPLIKPY